MNGSDNLLTPAPSAPDSADPCAQGSLLPDPASLMRIRLRKAELARLFGVSKACVTDWCQRGWVTVEMDGRIDPQRAARSLLTRADTSRLRTKILAGALDEVRELRRDRDDARREAVEARAELAALRAERDRLAAALAEAEAFADRQAAELYRLRGSADV